MKSFYIKKRRPRAIPPPSTERQSLSHLLSLSCLLTLRRGRVTTSARPQPTPRRLPPPPVVHGPEVRGWGWEQGWEWVWVPNRSGGPPARHPQLRDPTPHVWGARRLFSGTPRRVATVCGTPTVGGRACGSGVRAPCTGVGPAPRLRARPLGSLPHTTPPPPSPSPRRSGEGGPPRRRRRRRRRWW